MVYVFKNMALGLYRDGKTYCYWIAGSLYVLADSKRYLIFNV